MKSIVGGLPSLWVIVYGSSLLSMTCIVGLYSLIRFLFRFSHTWCAGFTPGDVWMVKHPYFIQERIFTIHT